MTLRDYRASDTDALIALFRDTVRTVNAADYSEAQVLAWAPDEIHSEDWQRRQARNETFVAEIEGKIAGFAELEDGRHIHMLFVQKGHQGHGVASGLLAHIEKLAKGRGTSRLSTDASITARPFFERRGFAVLEPQTVSLRGQDFRNFRMEKRL